MNIRDIGGEFGLIKRIAKREMGDTSVLVKNGDDAAVIRLGNSLLAVSTDAFVEGRHFSFDYMTPQSVGAKIIEGSSSDIVAMGARPKYAFLALCLPPDFSVEIIEQIYAGIYKACERLGVAVLGGDTTAGTEKLSITCTVLGQLASEDSICTRGGAKPGDLIYVSGPVGGASAGQRLLAQGVDGFETLKRAYLEPHCRIDVVDRLAPYATSMIDISDGLSSELWHVSTESNCGLVVELDKIPRPTEVSAAAQKLDLSEFDLMFGGGEDYELLYTIEAINSDVAVGTQIGEVIKGAGVSFSKDGQLTPLEHLGFDHFR